MIKNYLKRRKLLQKRFEKLVKKLDEESFFPDEKQSELIDKLLALDMRLSIPHPVLILIGTGIVVYFMLSFNKKLV